VVDGRILEKQEYDEGMRSEIIAKRELSSRITRRSASHSEHLLVGTLLYNVKIPVKRTNTRRAPLQ